MITFPTSKREDCFVIEVQRKRSRERRGDAVSSFYCGLFMSTTPSLLPV